MMNQTSERSKGYVRYSVVGDGDCGYTAFGISHEDAAKFLSDHIQSISNLISVAVKGALLTTCARFYQYLFNKI